MKKLVIVLSLLVLGIATTVGCGDSDSGSSTPTFTKVTFLSNRTVAPATFLFTSNLDGTSVTPIPTTASIQAPDLLSMSADSKSVVFLGFNPNDGIWISNTDGSGQKQVTTPGTPYWARISPSGKKIVYSDTTAYHIQVINPDGTGNQDLTATLPAGMLGCYDPSFSADNSQIAFTCHGAAGWGIFTVKADGTGLKTVEVRANNASADYAWFTPDGKKILFIGSFPSSSPAVGSVNLDGTGETLLAANANELLILNSSLYYENSCAPSAKIFKANLDGTNPVQITDGTNADALFSRFNCS